MTADRTQALTITLESGEKQIGILPVHRREARLFLANIPERTFARLEAEGIIVPHLRGKAGRPSVYNLITITPAYIQYLRSASPTSTGDRDARARRDCSQADLNELRLKERRKELLPRSQIVREGQAFVLAAKAKILALPRRMLQAGIITTEKQAAVGDLLREALEEMARWRKTADLLAAAKSDA